MAKDSIRDYSATSSDNSDIQSVDISEGCAPSGLNNAIREVMTDLKNVSTGAVALETPVADSFSTDTISEKTSATGVTIDGVLLKDGAIGSIASAVAAHLTSINGGQIGGSRNLIINGNMAVAQRGTSVTGVSDSGYETVDRFRGSYNGAPDQLRVTHAQVADAPDGLTNSFKLTVTTPETTLASDERVRFQQRIEAYNLQHLAFGTSSASAITLSFYVKSSITGTFGVDLKNEDAGRSAAQSYTISSANTWEKKTLTFAGDQTSGFNNDNGVGLTVSWVLAAGTDYTSGTLATAFASTTSANLAPSNQVNLIGTDNATWQLTGVQLEAGVATPFEHESYAETLRKCQRFYNRLGFMKHQFYSSSIGSSNPDLMDSITFPPMRDAPAANPYTDANYSSSGSTNATNTTLTLSHIGISSLISQAQRTGSGNAVVRTTYYLELVAEL